MCFPEFPAVKRLPTHSPHIFFGPRSFHDTQGLSPMLSSASRKDSLACVSICASRAQGSCTLNGLHHIFRVILTRLGNVNAHPDFHKNASQQVREYAPQCCQQRTRPAN